MRRIVLAAVLALAACSTPPQEIPPPAPRPQPPAPAPQSPVPAPPAARKDSCGAAAVQNLIGRPRSEIPVPLDPSRQRVACTTCPVTMDYSPQRLNFFFDAETGIIKQIRCG